MTKGEAIVAVVAGLLVAAWLDRVIGMPSTGWRFWATVAMFAAYGPLYSVATTKIKKGPGE